MHRPFVAPSRASSGESRLPRFGADMKPRSSSFPVRLASRETSRESSPASGRRSPLTAPAHRPASPLVGGVSSRAMMAKDISKFIPPELQGVSVKDIIAAIGQLL